MFVRVYLVSRCRAGDRDPIPFSDSDKSPQPDPIYGSGLVNTSSIQCVFPFDGDFNSDRCIIHLVNEPEDSLGYVSDDFQKIKDHFYLEF